jgi:hypothetical protein
MSARFTVVMSLCTLLVISGCGRPDRPPSQAAAPRQENPVVQPSPEPLSPQQQDALRSRVATVLLGLQSPDYETRRASFDNLSTLLIEGINDPPGKFYGGGIEGYRRVQDKFFALHPDEADSIRLGLIHLLETETRAEKAAPVGSRTEGDGEYFFSATMAVSGLHDERSIPALVGTIYSSGVDLLQFGDVALEPIVAQLKNPYALSRSKALQLAAIILESKKEAGRLSRVEGLIRESINDNAPVVRSVAIREIGCLDNRQEWVPVLEQIAKTDAAKLPGRADDGIDNDGFYPVRFEARRTLRNIENNKPCAR